MGHQAAKRYRADDEKVRVKSEEVSHSTVPFLFTTTAMNVEVRHVQSGIGTALTSTALPETSSIPATLASRKAHPHRKAGKLRSSVCGIAWRLAHAMHGLLAHSEGFEIQLFAGVGGEWRESSAL